MTQTPSPPDASVSLQSAEPLFSPFSILKNIGSSLVSLLGATFLGFLTSLVLARQLDHEVYGLYVIMLGIAGILTALADLGLGQVAVREISRYRHRTGSLMVSALLLRTAANGIILVLALLVLAVDEQVRHHETLTLIVIITMIVGLTTDLLRSVFAGFERFEFDLVTRLTERMVIFGLVLLALSTHLTLETAVEAMLIGSIIGLVFTAAICIYFVPARSLRPTMPDARHLLVAGAPLGASILIVSFYSRYDVIVLGALRTSSEVAWFSVAYSLITIIISLSFAASSALFPVLSRLAHSGHRDVQFGLYKLSLRYLIIIALALAGGLTVVANPVILGVYGDSYGPAAQALQILAFALLFILPTHLMLAVMLSLDRQRLVLASHLLSGVLLLVLDPLLIAWQGVPGAALTNVIVEGVIFAFCLTLVSRLLGWVGAGVLLRPLGAATLAAGAYLVLGGLPNAARLLVSMIAYGLALFSIRAITVQDIQQLRSALVESRASQPDAS